MKREMLPETKKIILNLREYRKSKHLTQAKVSKAAGVPFHTVNRLEWSDHTPSIDTVVRYAKAMGTTIGEMENWRPK